MIHQCQVSEASATKFKALLEEFYFDSPERLKVAIYGLSLIVKGRAVTRNRIKNQLRFLVAQLCRNLCTSAQGR